MLVAEGNETYEPSIAVEWLEESCKIVSPVILVCNTIKAMYDVLNLFVIF